MSRHSYCKRSLYMCLEKKGRPHVRGERGGRYVHEPSLSGRGRVEGGTESYKELYGEVQPE